jgi:hypothetical protein
MWPRRRFVVWGISKTLHGRSLIVLVCSAVFYTLSCGPSSHRLDFAELSSATRIEVTTNGIRNVATITDAAKIRDTANFIRQYPDNWTEPWGAGAGGWLVVKMT